MHRHSYRHLHGAVSHWLTLPFRLLSQPTTSSLLSGQQHQAKGLYMQDQCKYAMDEYLHQTPVLLWNPCYVNGCGMCADSSVWSSPLPFGKSLWGCLWLWHGIQRECISMPPPPQYYQQPTASLLWLAHKGLSGVSTPMFFSWLWSHSIRDAHPRDMASKPTVRATPTFLHWETTGIIFQLSLSPSLPPSF